MRAGVRLVTESAPDVDDDEAEAATAAAMGVELTTVGVASAMGAEVAALVIGTGAATVDEVE